MQSPKGLGGKAKGSHRDKPTAGRGHSELYLLWPPAPRVLQIILRVSPRGFLLAPKCPKIFLVFLPFSTRTSGGALFSFMNSAYPFSSLPAFRLLLVFSPPFLLMPEICFSFFIPSPVPGQGLKAWLGELLRLAALHRPATAPPHWQLPPAPALPRLGSLPPLLLAPLWTQTPSVPVPAAGKAHVEGGSSDKGQVSGQGLGPASGPDR